MPLASSTKNAGKGMWHELSCWVHDRGGERWHSCFDRRREINLFTIRCKVNEFSISRPPSTEMYPRKGTHFNQVARHTGTIGQGDLGDIKLLQRQQPGKSRSLTRKAHITGPSPPSPWFSRTMFYRRTYKILSTTDHPAGKSVPVPTRRRCQGYRRIVLCQRGALFFSPCPLYQ